MTRTLAFDAADGKRFELAFTGFILGGNQVHAQASRPRDERKREAKILRALKAISDPVASNGQPADEGRRTLADAGGRVVLEQDQLELLIKYVEACPFLTHVSDDVDALVDWLHAAPREP